MSAFEWISVSAFLVSGGFALVMLWYHASNKLEEVRFANTQKTQEKIEAALGALAKDLHAFKESMNSTVAVLTAKLHSLELTLVKQGGEMKSASEEMREAHRAFAVDWTALRKGWGEEVRPGEFLVREPNKRKGE